MKNKIKFIPIRKSQRINYTLTALIPSIIYLILPCYMIYMRNEYYSGNISKTIGLIALITAAVIPIAIFIINFSLRYLSTKPSFIFDNNEITDIYYPPLIYEAYLLVNKKNNNIELIEETNCISEYNMDISYQFHTLVIQTGYSTFMLTGKFSYTSANQHNIYDPVKFDIEIYKNNILIYKENLRYFEKIYFSDPYNKTIDMNKFIKTAINDALATIMK